MFENIVGIAGEVHKLYKSREERLNRVYSLLEENEQVVNSGNVKVMIRP